MDVINSAEIIGLISSTYVVSSEIMFNACALLMYIGCAAKDTLRQGAGKFLNQATMVMNVQLWLDVWSHHSTVNLGHVPRPRWWYNCCLVSSS